MRILLVEDRPDVREIFADGLRDAGHEVIEASDVPTACQALDRPGSFHAVITDLRLPGGSGLEVAHMATEAGIPNLICTGDPDAMNDLDAKGIRHLRKPFRVTKLVAWLSTIALRGGNDNVVDAVDRQSG